MIWRRRSSASRFECESIFVAISTSTLHLPRSSVRKANSLFLQEEIEQLKEDSQQEKAKFIQSTKAIGDAALTLTVPLKQPGDSLSVIDTGTSVDPQFSKIRSFVVQLQNDLFSVKDVWTTAIVFRRPI